MNERQIVEGFTADECLVAYPELFHVVQIIESHADSYDFVTELREQIADHSIAVHKAIMAEQTCGKCRYTDTCSIEKVFHDSAIYENHKPEECFCIGFRPIVEPTEDEG